MGNNYQLLPPARNESEPSRLPVVAAPAGTLAGSMAAPAGSADLDVFALLRILYRRKMWVCVCTVAMIIASALVAYRTTPEYVAWAQLQLVNQEMGRLSLKDAGDDGVGFDVYSTLQTDVTVMQSDTLALKIIKELNLPAMDEFRYEPLIKTEAARQQVNLDWQQSPLKRTAILTQFKNGLTVEVVPGTRLIAVSYKSPNPELAAKIVNQLVSDFVEYTFQVRYNATTKATDFLSKQLVDLKGQVEKSQQRAVELQKSSGILGADEHNNLIVNRLDQLNNELTAAQANRIVKEAIYNLASSGNPESVAGLLGASGGASAGASQTSNSLSVINHLREQESDLKAQYAEASTKYGSAYPRLIQMKERLAALETSIQAELSKVAESAKSEYELALSRETAARNMLAEQKDVAARMNDRAIDYTIAKHEAESNRMLYDSLLQKLKEADVLAGLRSSELNIVDPATVPGRPTRPRKRLYLLAGAFLGLTFGVIAAFVVEAMDGTMRNPEDIETVTQIPVIGVIPQGKLAARNPINWLSVYSSIAAGPQAQGSTNLITPADRAVAEAFRWLRTSLVLSQPVNCGVLMVASPIAQEGKSFSSLNLAAVLAQRGGKVLLVDADLRRATLSRMVGQSSGAGLSELLRGNLDGREIFRPVDHAAGLAFVAAGSPLSNPAELLGSEKMRAIVQGWREGFDHVVIDTPALLPVTDAVVLSPMADMVILVARFAFTESQSLVRAIRLLRSAQVKRIGVLVNAMDARSSEYRHYCGSYDYDCYEHDNVKFPAAPTAVSQAENLSHEQA